MLKNIIEKMKSTHVDVSLYLESNFENQYLNSLKEPLTDFQRSFNQYKCYKYVVSKKIYFLNTVVSLFLLIPFILFCYLRPKPMRISGINCDAVFLPPVSANRSIIPKELYQSS
jgi:hypothetical protein